MEGFQRTQWSMSLEVIISDPARRRGIWGCWCWVGGHVIRSPRAWWLVGLVNPCVFHRRVCRRLLMRFDSAVGRLSGVAPG